MNNPVEVYIDLLKNNNMDAQEIFYIVATIALIVVTIFLFGALFLIYKLQKFIRFSTGKIDWAARNIVEQIGGVGKTWGALTATRIAFKLLRKFMGR
ncbi:MAG TPA: hypothetical protein VD998_00015 [Verrucomicrobiae bacterium]|nr:hypothetical protein [Verrucomicrobiae bacterium]